MQETKSARILNKFRPAALWKRFTAYLIDILIIGFVTSLPFRNYFSSFDNTKNILLGTADNKFFLVGLFIIFAILFYFSFLEFKLRQTLGKMIMKIQVISTSNKELTFSQTLIRNATKPFSIVLLADVFYMLFKRGNQRLFEVFSNTIVVEQEMIFR